MADRKDALRRLAAGDIFHAESPNGASLVCLTLAVTETVVHARTVTTQHDLAFDRRTGVAVVGSESVVCTIDSAAPLPLEVHNAMLGLDRKFRLEKDLEKIKLTAAEKRALLYVDKHYASNPI